MKVRNNLRTSGKERVQVIELIVESANNYTKGNEKGSQYALLPFQIYELLSGKSRF